MLYDIHTDMVPIRMHLGDQRKHLSDGRVFSFALTLEA